MMEDDRDKGNSIGNIINSRIENMEQTIKNYIEKIVLSPDIPAEFKEPMQMWLMLSLKDLQYKEAQRNHMEQQAKEMERMARVQEKEAFIRRRTNAYAKWISLFLFILTIVFLFFFVIQPFYQTEILPKSESAVGFEKISIWLSWLPQNNSAFLLIAVGIAVYFSVLFFLSIFIAHWLAKHSANRKFGY